MKSLTRRRAYFLAFRYRSRDLSAAANFCLFRSGCFSMNSIRHRGEQYTRSPRLLAPT